MNAYISVRSATLNNDYYEMIDGNEKFGSEMFEIARDKAYEELHDSQISAFVTKDETYVYCGLWINVAYFATQNLFPKKFAYTKRVGNNETKSCISYKIKIEELEKFKNEEVVFEEEDFLFIMKNFMTDTMWNLPQGELYKFSENNCVKLKTKSDDSRPYYDKLLEAGESNKTLSIPTRKQAYIVISSAVNNMIRWNVKDYLMTAYVPSTISKKIDIDSTLYLNSYEKKRKVIKKLSAYCRKRKYGFEKDALKEIAEAGRCNFRVACEIVESVALSVKSKKITAETCIRIFYKKGVGYDGFTKQDIIALRLLKERVKIPEIRQILNMDEVKFDNLILNFLLGGKYVHSNGREFKVTEKGNEILLSQEILNSVN